MVFVQTKFLNLIISPILPQDVFFKIRTEDVYESQYGFSLDIMFMNLSTGIASLLKQYFILTYCSRISVQLFFQHNVYESQYSFSFNIIFMNLSTGTASLLKQCFLLKYCLRISLQLFFQHNVYESQYIFSSFNIPVMFMNLSTSSLLST